MDDPLAALRSALSANLKLELRTKEGAPTDDWTQAKFLHFPPVPGITTEEHDVDLNTKTRYWADTEGKTEQMDMKSVYTVAELINSAAAATKYKSLAKERGTAVLGFVQRTELITWLQGAAHELPGLDGKSGGDKAEDGKEQVGAKRGREVDPELQKVYDQERALVNHNTVLHGNKLIDFTSVAKECETKILRPYDKRAKTGADSKLPAARSSSSRHAHPSKPPIILLPQSASSLINRANAPKFLQDGKFDTELRPSLGEGKPVEITRQSSRLNGKVKFLLLDSMNFMSKEEYWNRVAAVFVTGQAWQFKQYKWKDPNQLFTHVPGLAVLYKDDAVPQTLKGWNVSKFELDRNQRFKDNQVVERIWEFIENNAIRKGLVPRR